MQDFIFCNFWGAKNSNKANFCYSCGKVINKDSNNFIESNKDVILSEAKNLTKNKIDSIESNKANIDVSQSLNMTDKLDSINHKEDSKQLWFKSGCMGLCV